MIRFFRLHTKKIMLGFLCLLPMLFLSGIHGERRTSSDYCELIVLWKDSLSAEESTRRLSALSSDVTLLEHFENITVCRSSSSTVSKQLELLNQHPSVRIAEPNHTAALCSFEDFNYFNTQWSLHNSGEYVYYINQMPIERTSLSNVDINLPEAYDILGTLKASRSVTVAVIDTGVDTTHPALSDHIWRNEAEIPLNGIDDDNNGYIDDLYGWDFYHNDNTVCHYQVSEYGLISADPEDNDNHGTHCAGIIASSQGIMGVASGIDIRILPLKIHGGPKASGAVSDAIKAIKYAEHAGAEICNMSWGTPVYSEALETVMRESGMLFVVAAGNSGNNNNASPLYPSSFELDNMISVAFVTQSGALASDSNYGSSTVDFAAPGQDIYSTTVGGGYHYLSGSSMAAPIVAGTAALLYACGDSLYPQNVKDVLLQTMKPLDSLHGYLRNPGIPDAAGALTALHSVSSDTVAPTLKPTTEYEGELLSVSLNPEDLGGSGVRLISYAPGERDISYFAHGTIGHVLSESVLHLGKPGIYTFYISDYAGNENTLVYKVEDDTTPPTLSAYYTLTSEDTFRVTIEALDSQSGIKRLRYLPGQHDTSAFLAGGYDLSSFTPFTFTVAKEGIYTIYASDYRGNKTTYSLDVKKIPASQLFLSTTERNLILGESCRLIAFPLPVHTTDTVSFTVSDESLLYAAPDGTLTALATGTVTVTATAGDGLSKSCLIHILAADTNNREISSPTDNIPTQDLPLIEETPSPLPQVPIIE